MHLRDRIAEDMKSALKAGEKARLGGLRLILSGVKQLEVDSGTAPDDGAVLVLLEKMVKQRRDSFTQFEAAGRADLAAQESFELKLIHTYLPEPLSASEIDALLREVLAATGAKGMADMGKVMAAIKPKVQGRADMSQLSARIKAHLSPA